jgi:hypothetical protein
MTTNRVLSSALAVSLAILGASPVLAAGEIIITQAKAIAGGVTAGDSPGFPVTLSQPGTYEFGSNIYPSAGKNGIRPAARNVTIDLNGFELNGAGLAGVGIDGGNSGLTIRNGTITRFAGPGGIYGYGDDWIVESMRVVGNKKDGISLASTSSAASIRNSTITNNGGTGIKCGYQCFVGDNIVSGNLSLGILLSSGTILGNTIINNKGLGISAAFDTGYGNNTLALNNGSGANLQVSGLSLTALHPNACAPACP